MIVNTTHTPMHKINKVDPTWAVGWGPPRARGLPAEWPAALVLGCSGWPVIVGPRPNTPVGPHRHAKTRPSFFWQRWFWKACRALGCLYFKTNKIFRCTC